MEVRVARDAHALPPRLADADILLQPRETSRTVTGGGVVVELEELAVFLRRGHERFQIAGDRGIVRVPDDIDKRVLQNGAVGRRIACGVRLFGEHVTVDAGDGELTQAEIVRGDIELALMVEDIDLDTFINANALHGLRQHALAVRNEGGRAALDGGTVLRETEALHAAALCRKAVFRERGPRVTGEDRVGMGVDRRRHFA